MHSSAFPHDATAVEITAEMFGNPDQDPAQAMEIVCVHAGGERIAYDVTFDERERCAYVHTERCRVRAEIGEWVVADPAGGVYVRTPKAPPRPLSTQFGWRAAPPAVTPARLRSSAR